MRQAPASHRASTRHSADGGARHESADDELVIEVVDLHKRYGNLVAVDGVTFSVRRGEIFGLLGPNGAGKTTAVECVQGLRRFDAGSIRVVGLDPRSQAADLRLRIGCQLQSSALPDSIRVWEALDMFASLYDYPVDWHVLLDQWGLSEKRSTRFQSLSGGQKQRLFVALALVNNPEVVFLDEMTTGLDPAARRVAWELVDELRTQGATVVLVTHFMDEAEWLCDRVAVMERGRLIALDTPRGLMASHGSGVRAVFSCEPTADLAFLEKVDGVSGIARSGARVDVAGGGAHVALVAAALVAHGMAPSDLQVVHDSLEDVFLALTGHALED